MPPIRRRKVLDLKGADAVMDAAERAALADERRVVIAVVDPWGRLLHLRRTEDAQAASDQVALDKARTAAIFVRPSRDIEAQVSGGRLGALALHRASALTGGIPLVADGEVVGAIGTSGETPDQDEAISLAGARAPFSTREVFALTHDGARLAAEAAGAAAAVRAVWPVVAITDAGGELLYLWRLDQAQVASVAVAADKARTAAIFRRRSKDFEEQAAHGRPSALHLAGAVPLQGGIPVVIDGEVVGAVGVSGASSADEDNELAVLGAAAVEAAALDGAVAATHVSAADLAERFATGGLFLDTGGFKLDAGRRSGPGEVEYHERTADIMHVVDGTATVRTGGRMIAARTVGPGELRSAEADGGIDHQLGSGDVLVVPAGVPHQFTAVSDPFHYLVVKVEG
jgi:glc operon protein GlcG